MDEFRRPPIRPRVVVQAELHSLWDGRVVIKKEYLDRIWFGIGKIHFAEDLKRLRSYLT